MKSGFLTLVLLCGCALLCAQLKPVTPADYGKFESLGAGTLSPDGKWLSYVVNRSDRNNELRNTNIATGEMKSTTFGTAPAFSSDSRWVAFGIGMAEAQEEKLRKDKKPVHRKLALLNLAKGEQVIIHGVESFAFSPNGAYLAMRRYAPEKAPASATPPVDAAETETPPPGATLIVRDLASGRDSTFGNVSEFAWQDMPRTGHLLALAISAEDKTGNGIQLFDPVSGTLRILDSGTAVFSGLSWRKKGSDLAALRSQADQQHEGSTQVLLAWTHLSEASETARRLDPASPSVLPADMRTVGYRKPSWTEDGSVVFVGIAKWDRKLPKKSDAAKDPKTATEPDEQPTVDVWHWRDPDVIPKQKIVAKADRERNLLAAWQLDSMRLVRLGDANTERILPLKHQKVAASINWAKYAMERSIGRPAADLGLVDINTGARTKIKDGVVNDFQIQPSPGGKYLLFFQDDQYWTVNTATKAVVSITKGVKTSFVDRESDFTVKQKPAFGVAGWTKDDGAVILYDKFDLWQVAPDGGSAKRLTDGAANEVRHRYLHLDQEEDFIDTSKPVYVSLFGIWTKQSGCARIAGGHEEHLILENRGIGRIAKARDSETYLYSSESFEESPNYFVGNSGLKGAKKVTALNPFQANYAWSRSELIEYKDSHGQRLQGALFYPAGYETGKKYPMVVYLYEKLSDGIHRFSAPGEREYYNPAAIVSNGYFLLMPDIVFQPREPGVSVADCVTAAVNTVIAKGSVDPKRIGVIGHSWGGYDTTYLATHTKLFAAAVAGAPITDLISNYGNHHWSSGIAETDHIETGQQRMEVPLWEDLQAYIRNSAVFNAHHMTTPLLIEVGDADGTVFFHQGVELYNVARRAGKPTVLLVYAGEDHGLRKKANQMDYQRRIFAWFGHYLKGDTAAPWITEGETFLQHQQALKAAKAAGTP